MIPANPSIIAPILLTSICFPFRCNQYSGFFCLCFLKAAPLTTMQEVVQELNADHSTVVWHLK